jgi:hypothetical protein
MSDGQTQAEREYLPVEAVPMEKAAMTPQAVVAQQQAVYGAMKSAMKDGNHYGVIPGCQKPSLLKPGAEKLCVMFRLDPQYEVEDAKEEDTFIMYRVKCTLWHMPTGKRVGSGIGACNSKEKKYKRQGDVNAWDVQNTILKMAEKRALVAATLNATGASDIFTQDLEDAGPPQQAPQPQPGPPPQQAYTPPPPAGSPPPVTSPESYPDFPYGENAPAEEPPPEVQAAAKAVQGEVAEAPWGGPGPAPEEYTYRIEVGGSAAMNNKDVLHKARFNKRWENRWDGATKDDGNIRKALVRKGMTRDQVFHKDSEAGQSFLDWCMGLPGDPIVMVWCEQTKNREV